MSRAGRVTATVFGVLLTAVGGLWTLGFVFAALAVVSFHSDIGALAWLIIIAGIGVGAAVTWFGVWLVVQPAHRARV